MQKVCCWSDAAFDVAFDVAFLVQVSLSYQLSWLSSAAAAVVYLTSESSAGELWRGWRGWAGEKLCVWWTLKRRSHWTPQCGDCAGEDAAAFKWKNRDTLSILGAWPVKKKKTGGRRRRRPLTQKRREKEFEHTNMDEKIVCQCW